MRECNLNAREIAEMFNVTEAVVRGWVDRGLPHRKYNRGRSIGIYFNPDEVKVWMKKERELIHSGEYSLKGNNRPICQKCHWFGTSSKTCDYFLRTGQRRKGNLTDVSCEQFTKRISGKVQGNEHKRNRMTPEENQKFKEYMSKHEARLKGYIDDLKRKTF